MNKKFQFNTISTAMAAAMVVTASVADAAVYIKYDGIDGEAGRTDKWFVADSFSFGVEREMKESGEKGGTEDLNIGIGELQECTISKAQDSSSITLAQLALTGRSLGKVEMCVTRNDDSSGAPPASVAECFMHIVMQRAYVKSWSTSGDADDRPTEEVAFYYNKIAFAYSPTDDGTAWNGEAMSWDNVKNRPWQEGSSLLFND